MCAVDLSALIFKVGQFMFTCLDLRPPETTRELENLQGEALPSADTAKLNPVKAVAERAMTVAGIIGRLPQLLGEVEHTAPVEVKTRFWP